MGHLGQTRIGFTKRLSLLVTTCLGLLSSPLTGESHVLEFITQIEVQELDPGIAFADCIYVINLAERPERWARTKKQLDERQLKSNRVEAVNGWKLTPEEMERLATPNEVRLPNGHIGCLLSHLSVYVDALERGFETIWVLEDDLEFLQDVEKLGPLLKRLEAFDPEWDILYTDRDFRDEIHGYLRSTGVSFRPDYQYKTPSYYQKRCPASEGIEMMGQRFGTRSFLISRRGMEKVVDFYRNYSVWNTLDVELHYINGIREYCTEEDIVSNRRIRLYGDTGWNSFLNPEKK